MTNKEKYAAICDAADIPLFAQYWWLDAICKKWDVAIVDNGHTPAGAWAYPLETKLGLPVCRLPVLTPYLGPNVLFPKDLRPARRDSFEHDIIQELLKQLPAFRVLETALVPGLRQAGIFKNNGYDITVRQTFLIDLQANDEPALLANLHEDTRRNIARAEKEITIADEPSSIMDLYNFQKATLDRRDVNIRYSSGDLQRMYETCKVRNCTALWTAKKDGITQAVLWNMWDKTRSYYLVGAKNPAVNDRRAVTALIWHAIKHCKALGKSTFDFEGSMIPGVERFFRTFGTRRELYLVVKKNKSLRWKLLSIIR